MEGRKARCRWRYERKEVSLKSFSLSDVDCCSFFNPAIGQVSAHETSFTLSPLHSLSLLLLHSSSSLIFALNISQRTGSGRVTYCSSTLGSLSRWRRRFVRPFSAVAPATSIKEEERRGEKRRRRRAGGRETEEYGRVQLNGKKDEDETRGTSTGMMFRFWREGEFSG